MQERGLVLGWGLICYRVDGGVDGGMWMILNGIDIVVVVGMLTYWV